MGDVHQGPPRCEAATDFLTAEVLTFYGLVRVHILFVIDVATRRVEIVPIGEGHLRKVVAQFVDHYHRERNHQGIRNQLLMPGPEPANGNGRVRRRERLGGLLSFYYRDAA